MRRRSGEENSEVVALGGLEALNVNRLPDGRHTRDHVLHLIGVHIFC